MIEPLIRWHRPPTEPADPGLLDEIRARPLRYPLGSGEAEEVALLARLKPMIRQRLSPERARERREFYRQRGLATDEIPLPGLSGLTLLLAGWNALQVEEAADCERDMYGERSTEERILTLGRLLGYPRCCVEAFLEVPGDRENEGLLRATTRRTEGPGDPWLNVLDLHVFHLISWTPCSFRCELSGRYAARVAGLLRPHFRPFLLNIHRALAHARLYLHDSVQISMEGELRPDGYWPLHALPTARDRSPSSMLDPAAERDAAHALHAVRNARCIQSQGDLILLDGEPWASGFLATFQGLARGLDAPFGVVGSPFSGMLVRLSAGCWCAFRRGFSERGARATPRAPERQGGRGGFKASPPEAPLHPPRPPALRVYGGSGQRREGARGIRCRPLPTPAAQDPRGSYRDGPDGVRGSRCRTALFAEPRARETETRSHPGARRAPGGAEGRPAVAPFRIASIRFLESRPHPPPRVSPRFVSWNPAPRTYRLASLPASPPLAPSPPQVVSPRSPRAIAAAIHFLLAIPAPQARPPATPQAPEATVG